MAENSLDRVRYDLDLDQSRAPGAFRDEQNLWKDDLKRIYLLIERHVAALGGKQKSDNRRDSDPKQLPHLSIAIFGPSGSGKSSLLQTLEDDANRKEGGVKHEKGLEGKIYSLPVIDPTTWSDTDQFLYAFLATALEEEANRQEHKEDGFPQGLSPVQLAFQEVNEYLRVVDESEASEEYDPLGLSLQKLERHTSGLRLREALGKFIRALTKEFKSEVIILPVDDLDLAPVHLVKSLRTYQSFLAHAPLVPIFTFTDRMSEELIEAHYEASISGPKKCKERKSISESLTVSEKLAVQFLARCFPVRNRIRLGPAPGRVQRAFFSYQGYKLESEKPKREKFQILELITIASFLLFGHPDNKDAHKVRAALRPSTLRRQLQVVDAMADCRLSSFRIPQLAIMAFPRVKEDILEDIATYNDKIGFRKDWAAWSKSPKDKKLGDMWHPRQLKVISKQPPPIHRVLAYRLRELGVGATWATIFNGAVWSLLNVHRDTLRELGLFLEDLYSWNPRELRSVVLRKILDQDQATRRTVVDRWFNRTDYRRSQVLSLLAANIFRPWMKGEEPYGDEEIAIHKQRELESKDDGSKLTPLDREWEEDTSSAKTESIRDRLSFPAQQGLLWFIDVTMGFYLPQIMARDWPDRVSSKDFLKERMSGNGWDLRHAPVSAIRVADAKQEIGSFGMVFLDPKGYSRALQYAKEKDCDEEWRNHLMLRIWSCYGYNRSKFWSAFSLWRGLGLIGQLLELFGKEQEQEDLFTEMVSLIHSHCLAGLMPGSLLGHDADEDLLQCSFQRWEPYEPALDTAARELANDLVKWLRLCRHDCIFPLPAADVWIGWRDCFVRRIHGEYILGALWPRLNSAYLEKHTRNPECRSLAETRSSKDPEGNLETDDEKNIKPDEGENVRDYDGPWTAALASAVWSDTLLEYWRGCPQILFQLLTCPVFFKSRERFGGTPEEARDLVNSMTSPSLQKDSKAIWLNRLTGLNTFWNELAKVWTQQRGDRSIAPTLVSDILCIRRAHAEHSSPPQAFKETADDTEGDFKS